MQIDVVAIGAHPDDCELVCGGTLLRCKDQGRTTGIIDLTRGERATRGTPAVREAEAAQAAAILRLDVRLNAELPDAGLFNTDETRQIVVDILRRLRPRVVILPWINSRHPDHRMAAALGRDACFLAGLARFGRGEAGRPEKIVYALAYQESAPKPTFVVDISEQFSRKREALRCHASQLDGRLAAGELFANGQPLLDLVETHDQHCGARIRCGYGEPFFTEECVRVDDLVAMGVASF